MGRSLKNYEQYREKILCYAQAIDIDVRYGEESDDGRFVPTKRLIILDSELEHSTEIATLLHELGHATDDSLYDKRAMKVLDRAYPAFYSGIATDEQKLMVQAVERRAWVFARSIAKRLRIKLGKWFDEEEQEALCGYMEF